MSTSPTPLGAIARGLAAGLVGTGVMTLAQTLPSKLQSAESGSNGGDSQDQQSKDPWEEASAPAFCTASRNSRYAESRSASVSVSPISIQR